MTILTKQIKKELDSLKGSKRAENYSRFFKTGKGEYGEGDVFIGVKTPDTRKVAKKYFKDIKLEELSEFLKSHIHEYRFLALVILVYKYQKPETEKERKKIFDFYLKNTRHINNWDLVDVTAPHIVGNYLVDKDRSVLYKLAKSKSLWEKRIAILSTFAFIRNNDFKDALKISKMLLEDSHDLMHKAVGWMLREVGKRDENLLEEFLQKNYSKIPRTTLRYAIEKFPEKKRKTYLNHLSHPRE